jgi:hypothetical protein
MAESKISITDMIKYIERNVNELSISEKQDILHIIMNSSIENRKVQTKGDGTQIKFKDIPKYTIVSIYHYIKDKLAIKLAALEYFPDTADKNKKVEPEQGE